ncbi:unnamed protein product [Clavelina lepadiformis]|uniref:Uncharacterized protein n=1 Tax=Clavelina lepadiformis TaxID=159417 RepID=A0ABP0FUI1_CLALP
MFKWSGSNSVRVKVRIFSQTPTPPAENSFDTDTTALAKAMQMCQLATFLWILSSGRRAQSLQVVRLDELLTHLLSLISHTLLALIKSLSLANQSGIPAVKRRRPCPPKGER